MDAFRRRVGNYRIIFDADFKTRSVRILDILRRTTTTYPLLLTGPQVRAACALSCGTRTMSAPMGFVNLGASRCSLLGSYRDEDAIEAPAQGDGPLFSSTHRPPGGGRAIPQAGTAWPMPGRVDRRGGPGLASGAHQAQR